MPPPPPTDGVVPPPAETLTSVIDYTGEGIETPHPDDRLDALPAVPGYEILSVIGRGGMGLVLRARHVELQRTVALKMLRGVWIADPELRERFQVEAEAIARLQHPNIIQVFGIGTAEARPGEVHPSPYLSLEYLDGGDLERFTDTPQAPEFAARVVEKVARAAHAAHQVGVIHRDLKPANVLLTRDREPKVADFGLAKQLAGDSTSPGRSVTQEGTVVGTPEYMAPEQITNKSTTPAIDVYALGVILYELLTARRPFQGTNLAETLHQVMYLEPVPPRRLQPGLPRDLETICLRCLEKDPARRYATAAELADDLGRWAEGRPIHARPVGPLGLAVRWARRNPALAALSALLVLVAVAGFAGVFWKWREAEANAYEASASATEAKQRTEAERWKHYRANVVAAASALQLNNVATARRLLQTAPEEHRNWEWRHLEQRLDLAQVVLGTDLTAVEDTWVSPDGRWLAITTTARAVQIWDACERRLVRTFENAPERFPMRLNADASLFAYQTPAHEVVVREVVSGRVRHTLRGHTKPVTAFLFTPDGRRVVTSSLDHTARVWDTETGAELITYRDHGHAVGLFGDHTSGHLIATNDMDGYFVRVWDVRTGRTVSVTDRHAHTICWGNLSPKGDLLLVVEAYPTNDIRVWNVADGSLAAVLHGHANQPMHCEFSPDGERIVSSSLDQTARVWEARSGRLLLTLRGHLGRVVRAHFSPDGGRIATAGEDQTVRLWNATTGEPLAVLQGHTNKIAKLAYTAGGASLVSVSVDGSVRVWDARRAETSDALRGHTNFVYGVTFLPDGKRVASVAWDGTARVWDLATGKHLAELNHGEKVIVAALALHPDGRTLATLSRDDTVRFWDLQTGQLLDRWTVAARSWQDPRLAFRPQGDLLAVGCNDGTVRLWDVKQRAAGPVMRGHRDGVRDVAFSPDGRWLASAGEGSDRTVRVWDVETRTLARVLEGHASTVYCLAFRPDGRVLASGSTDGTVRVWDTAGWSEEAVLKVGTNVYGLAYTGDGSRLACGCADNVIRIWDTARHEVVGELRGHDAYVHAVAFSPDGTRLVSASGDFTLRVWDTVSFQDRAANR